MQSTDSILEKVGMHGMTVRDASVLFSLPGCGMQPPHTDSLPESLYGKYDLDAVSYPSSALLAIEDPTSRIARTNPTSLIIWPKSHFRFLDWLGASQSQQTATWTSVADFNHAARQGKKSSNTGADGDDAEPAVQLQVDDGVVIDDDDDDDDDYDDDDDDGDDDDGDDDDDDGDDDDDDDVYMCMRSVSHVYACVRVYVCMYVCL